MTKLHLTQLLFFKNGGKKLPAYRCENGSDLFCMRRYQILFVGYCKHNEHWGIVFEGTSKSVQTYANFVQGIWAAVYGGVTTPKYNYCEQPQSSVLLLNSRTSTLLISGVKPILIFSLLRWWKGPQHCRVFLKQHKMPFLTPSMTFELLTF